MEKLQGTRVRLYVIDRYKYVKILTQCDSLQTTIKYICNNSERACSFGRGLRHLNICEPLTLEKSLCITEKFEKFETAYNPFTATDTTSTSIQFDSRKKHSAGNNGASGDITRNNKVGNCLVLYDKSSCDWMIAFIGCLRESFPVVVVHHSTSLDILGDIVNQCGASAIM